MENKLFLQVLEHARMSDSLTDLILSLTPEDGSSIGNGAMMALLREHVPDLSDEDYAAVRDALVNEGVLGRGRGRGGSIYRADVTDLTLEMQDEDEPTQPRGKPRSDKIGKFTPVRRTGAGAVLSPRRDAGEQPRGRDGPCRNRSGRRAHHMGL